MRRAAGRGFTLVEVLVALLLMAILSTFAWFGFEGVLRARDASRAIIDSSSRLATVMTQWEQDLHAVHDTGVVPALAFDGRSLRLTRRVDGGVALVVWSLQAGRWQRWAGQPVVRGGDLQQVWLASQQFLGNEAGQLVLAESVADWQLYFFRGNSWSNAQSTGNAAAPPGQGAGALAALREELPAAVRLVIGLQPGKVTRDIALGPSGS